MRIDKNIKCPEVASQKVKRQASPVVLSIKKVLSTKAVLRVAMKRNRSNSRSESLNAKTEVSGALIQTKNHLKKCNMKGQSHHSHKKHDCLNRERKDSEQESGLRDVKQRVAYFADGVGDRQRRLKPSLKKRSSSGISTVKKELAKQLHALRNSGGPKSP
jgi:hypothetical protein